MGEDAYKKLYKDKYTEGQKINKNGKVYTYVGNDEWEG
jgi:hypothetical protein